ncbi:MAG: hypothetical protein AAGA93_08975 [Actinomycetota bacterium]
MTSGGQTDEGVALAVVIAVTRTQPATARSAERPYGEEVCIPGPIVGSQPDVGSTIVAGGA